MEEEERKSLLGSVVKKLTVEDPSTSSGQVGKVMKEDFWGLRDLAYPIKRQTKGFYAHFELETAPKNVKGIDKTLQLEENILRYLLIRR